MKSPNVGSRLILASLWKPGLCQEETACQVSIRPLGKKKKTPLGEVLFVFGIQGPWGSLMLPVPPLLWLLPPVVFARFPSSVGMLHISLPPPISK